VAQCDELVNVELVIGEQHVVLKMRRAGAAVMAQAVQRVVGACPGEQRQRLGLTMGPVPSAVGDAVVHRCQVGQVKHIAQTVAARGCHFAFHVLIFCK
jgi:hypothetical protein